MEYATRFATLQAMKILSTNQLELLMGVLVFMLNLVLTSRLDELSLNSHGNFEAMFIEILLLLVEKI